MVARSYERGHEIIYKDGWVYADTGEPIKARPCIRCKRMPVDGHDACLGHIPGVSSACCGHGVEPGYVRKTGVPSRQELYETLKKRSLELQESQVVQYDK
jgi:hypothetical protein